MLRRLAPTSASWRRRAVTPWRFNPSRQLRVSAAVSADDDAKSAVDDCLERVLSPGATPASAFAVVFFEGHHQAEVQDALHSFAERRPQAPPVIGCSLRSDRQKLRLKKQQSARRKALASSSPLGKPGHKLTPLSSSTSSSPSDNSSLESSDSDSLRSRKIVTVLGFGFPGEESEGEDGGGDGGRTGRIEALPMHAQGGCFPVIHGKGSIGRIFELPKDKQPLFFILSKKCQTVPASDLHGTDGRLGNLLPNSTRLVALSSGHPSTVVSSFPAGDAPVVGVCLMGDIPLEEQAGLARKTLGAFRFSEVDAAGPVCDELFVPSQQPPNRAGWFETVPSLLGMDTLQRAQAQVRILAEQSERERRWRQQQQQQQHQLGVFEVDEVVFPGMTKRFHIFEPRYRALVKQCLAEDMPLVILPLPRGGNTVATVARVSGLHNVQTDGRCEVELTGVARCKVKTMWTKLESFSLLEAEVELFGDEEEEEGKEKVERSPDSAPTHAPRATADAATSGRATHVTGSDKDVQNTEGAGGNGGNGEALVEELPEVERLRIEVAAIMQKELYRTRTKGRSPLWPGWDTSVSESDAQAAFTVASSPFPSPVTIITANGDIPDAVGSSGGDGFIFDGDGANNITGAGGGAETCGGTSIGDKSSIGGLDPCDLDAEALSYWAAHNVEVGASTKHRWLSSTSTVERLRGVRDMCRFALARHRGRSGVDGSVLSRPISALHDLTSR